MNNDFTTSACGSGCASCSSGCGPTDFSDISIERPLGKVTAILAGLGLEVTYAYDDLVFIQHSAFLLQFTEEPNTLMLYSNNECDAREASNIASTIVLAFDKGGFVAEPAGQYSISQNEDQSLTLTFDR